MRLLPGFLVLAVALVACQASAGPVTFKWTASSSTVISSNGVLPQAAPGGISPAYLQLDFVDVGADQVKLTITANLAGIANVDTVSFNIQPESLADALTVTSASPSYLALQSNTNAGPVHTFDLALNTGQGQNSIGPVEVGWVNLGLTSGTGLTAESFRVTAAYEVEGVTKQFYAAAHFQNLNNAGASAFVASGNPPPSGEGDSTPLPSAALAGFGLMGGLGLTRRRQK